MDDWVDCDVCSKWAHMVCSGGTVHQWTCPECTSPPTGKIFHTCIMICISIFEHFDNMIHIPIILVPPKPTATCAICVDADVNRVAVPCGHCVCDACASRLEDDICPFCRCPVNYINLHL